MVPAIRPGDLLARANVAHVPIREFTNAAKRA
jgi:hypothetical protein